MIRIELDESSVARTRIVISPLWEALCSLRLLARYPDEAPFPYSGWARRAREVLAADAHGLLELVATSAYLPDFFCPVPPEASPTIEQELAGLRETDHALVRHQLDRVPALPPAMAVFRDEPGEALERLAEAIALYWDGALASYWPRMRSALEEEVLVRARVLAARGAEAFLGDLHDRVLWEAPMLTLVKSPEFAFPSAGRRLALIPLIFSAGALMCSTDDPDTLAVSYQARGAVVLADGPSAQRTAASTVPVDRLALLLGSGRASVLRGLSRPSTTAGLANQLGLAASTVSAHLAGLHEAGVVSRSRVGRRVFYALEPVGRTLVEDLSAGPRLRAAS